MKRFIYTHNVVTPLILLSLSSSTEATAAECTFGELTSFAIEKVDFTPQQSSLLLGQTWEWMLQLPSNEQNVRLDVCFDITGSKPATLKRVVWIPGQYQSQMTSDGSNIISEKGLDAAIFGNYKGFEIKARANEIDAASGILLKGFSEGEKSFVGAIPAIFKNTRTTEFTSMNFIYGALSNFDPFTGSDCSPGESESTSEFLLGTAKFVASTCDFLGGGETKGYRITKIVISDSNSELLTPIEQTLKGDELAAALTYRYNHHNACDSLVLKLNDAQYAVSSAPNAGCGTTIPDAPTRSFNDGKGVLYTTQYGSKPRSAIQEINCKHFLWCKIGE